jgi:hypothetical protein
MPLQASGWDPAFQRERLLQAAYSSIFLWPPHGQAQDALPKDVTLAMT